MGWRSDRKLRQQGLISHNVFAEYVSYLFVQPMVLYRACEIEFDCVFPHHSKVCQMI